MTRRFWLAVALSIPVLVLSMGRDLIPALHDAIPTSVATWAQLALATPVVLWAGWPFFVRGWPSVRTRKLNMFTLIAMGTGVAWLYSVVATVVARHLPGGVPRPWTARVAVYFEAAAVITVLVLLGQVLELRAREQTSGAIKALLDLAPKTARRIAADGTDEDVAARARPGRRPAARPPRREGAGRRRRRRTAAPRSTSRWSPASRCRSPRPPATTSSAARSTRPARFVMRAEKVGRDTHAGAHRADGRRGAALPRADPAAGRPGRRPGSCPP